MAQPSKFAPRRLVLTAALAAATATAVAAWSRPAEPGASLDRPGELSRSLGRPAPHQIILVLRDLGEPLAAGLCDGELLDL